MYRVGIDLGGTKIEGVVLNGDNKELIRHRVATEQEGGYEHILQRIHDLYAHLKMHCDDLPHTLGIGTPGAIARNGLLKNSNTLCLNGKPLKGDLVKKLGRQVSVHNDANCFAMAEAKLGAGAGHRSVFGVIMGTGCGGGIVWDGMVIEGLQTIAGEWGHMSIDPNGPQCYCGKNGCVETFISGAGVERQYRNIFGEVKRLVDIVGAYRAGEEKATEIMEEFFNRFGLALSNLINILDPDVVVLGGGVSNIDELYTKGVEKVKRYVFNDELLTPILKNKCGDSAGVLGAAFIGI